MAAMPEAQRASLGDGESLLKQTLGPLKSRLMRFFIGFDPATALRRVTCPVFAVFGGLDIHVPAAETADGWKWLWLRRPTKT
jgi:fermentation-respiration switch protein FrsA (DUF1100 family)